MKLFRLPLSTLLPLITFIVWMVLIAPVMSIVLMTDHADTQSLNLSESKSGGGVALKDLDPETVTNITVSLDHPKPTITERFSHTIQAITLPALAVELLISRFSSRWPDSWVPWGLDFELWRAFIDPIYCLPFWWIAGFGIDALLERRKPRWPALLLGSLLCGFFVFIALGLTFGVPAADHEDMSWVFYGFALWVALFATFPATWIRRGIASRKAQAASPTQIGAI